MKKTILTRELLNVFKLWCEWDMSDSVHKQYIRIYQTS